MANGSDGRPIAYINARLIDPSADTDQRGAVLIGDGKILDYGANLFSGGAPYGIATVDCQGHCLAPGIVDLRVHTGEPGEEHKETFDTAGRAAAAGGVTSMCILPDTEPPFDDASLIEFVARRARQVQRTKMYAYGALTLGLKGEQLAEIGLISEAGAVAFTDGDKPIASAQLMRRALYYAKTFDALIVQTPQEPTLSSGAMNSGELATRLGLGGNHKLAEAIQLERDVRLVEMTGGRYHASKISTAEGVDIIRRAKARGLKVTCDTAPHYFALNEIAVGDYRTFAKVVPPLRTEADRLAVVEGVRDGTIDCIVSDHRPQDVESKRVPFAMAEPGVVGLETLLPIALELYHNGQMTLPRIWQRLTTTPSKLFKLPAGRLEKGAPADLVLFDPDIAWVIDPEKFESKTGNTAFDERPTQGRVLMTVLDGRVIHRDKHLWPEPVAA
ncbi:MAG: dihydroorotase [Alphaproteobacteria bacterium]|nr:dihydroorotase [Alphaproteobacteria bacterium]